MNGPRRPTYSLWMYGDIEGAFHFASIWYGWERDSPAIILHGGMVLSPGASTHRPMSCDNPWVRIIHASLAPMHCTLSPIVTPEYAKMGIFIRMLVWMYVQAHVCTSSKNIMRRCIHRYVCTHLKIRVRTNICIYVFLAGIWSHHVCIYTYIYAYIFLSYASSVRERTRPCCTHRPSSLLWLAQSPPRVHTSGKPYSYPGRESPLCYACIYELWSRIDVHQC